MSFLTKITEDIKLRNLTIYAQWLGAATGVFLGLYNYWFIIKLLSRGSIWRWQSLQTIYLARLVIGLISDFVIPLGPCFLELPPLYMRFPRAIIVFLAWYMLAFIGLLGTWSTHHHAAYWGLAINICALMLTMFQFIIAPSSRSIVPHGNRLFCISYYVMFATPFVTVLLRAGLLWSTLLLRPPFVVAVLAILTAALYCMACVMGHNFISSQVLGGSGVERLDFTIAGLGPELDSIEDEGAIRL
ncbi:hypothetical protein F5Y16DRAFT_72059 [Xylariaceae sp. FL0255]|nr:hypothetical protein F5Y16DRAFT_72059 [Xylariaceae sp. FL0255]